MNKIVLMGRLTAEPLLKYSTNDTSMAIVRYTLAVDRPKKKGEDKAETDFIRCVSFGKSAEFASQYFTKGLRVLVSGRLQIGSYKNKDDVTIPTADVVIETQEFADTKKESNNSMPPKDEDPNIGFEDIPESIDDSDDDELPFT